MADTDSMRVLLSTIGSRGDVQPLVALATALTSLGHAVRLCVPPDFHDWIAALGMDVVSIDPTLRRPPVSQSSPAPPSPMTAEQRRQLAEASVAAQFTTIAGAADDCDVIVGATALQIAAPSVAERLGIPYVFVAYSPNVLPSPRHAPPPLPAIPGETPLPEDADNRARWARDTARFNALFGPALNAHRATIHLPPVDDVRGYVTTERPWLAADPALAPWPDFRHRGRADRRVDPAGYAPTRDRAGTLPRCRRAAGVLRLRSMNVTADVGRTMLDAARALGRRAVLSRGWAELTAPDAAQDCLVIAEANQQALFNRVTVAVHHGGAGTTTAAALAGAPQLIVPQIYDQHHFAARVHDLGIGVAHAPGTPTIDSLTAALEQALSPDLAATARAFSARIRRDGAARAAARLTSAS